MNRSGDRTRLSYRATTTFTPAGPISGQEVRYLRDRARAAGSDYALVVADVEADTESHGTAEADDLLPYRTYRRTWFLDHQGSQQACALNQLSKLHIQRLPGLGVRCSWQCIRGRASSQATRGITAPGSSALKTAGQRRKSPA